MAGELSRYYQNSRRLTVSLVLVLPLLLVYEAGILLAGSRVVNHAGELVRRMIALLGVDAYLALTAMVAALFVIVLVAKRSGASRRFTLYWLMIVEAFLYGALLGPIASLVPRAVLSAAEVSASTGTTLLLYIGAGVWEELVFRFAILGGLVWLTVHVLKGRPAVFTAVSLLASAVLFSLFHHLGSLGEPFEPGVFLFRTAAGLALGVVYLFRGLGICVCTHAFYNVARLLFP